MKLHHAAALALVGWYLIVPPVDQNTRSSDSKAPITDWTILGKFGTEITCRKGLNDHVHLIREMGDSGYALTEKLQTTLLSEAQCIAENDRRFKGWKGSFIGLIR